MNYKYKLNSTFLECESFLLEIESYFQKSQTQSIHKARNELKIIPCKEQSTVVKSFKVPHLLNRIVYTFFRDSKAKKSYEYSLKIGDFTPKPIGYIEFYSSGLLAKSFFISEEFAYDFTIREPLLERDFEDKEGVFKAFAAFTLALHQEGILHKDYSPGNILIKKESEGYTFKVVDINRMEFKELSDDERLQNFDKLWAKDDDLRIIIKEYAKLAKMDEDEAVAKALRYSQKLKDFKNMKKRLKGKPVVD